MELAKKKFNIKDRTYIEGCLRVNMTNVQSMADNGLLKHYAVFLKLKSLNRKSIIFDYTQKKLSKVSGMSISAVRKYVKFFLENNWCRLHCGHLVFNKLHSIDSNKQKLIKVLRTDRTIKEILTDLYLLILQKKQLQFDKFKKLKRDLSLSQNVYKSKKANALLDKLGLDANNLPNANDNIKLSINGMSKLFGGCSKGKAAGIIKALKLSGSVTCIAGKRTGFLMPNKQCAQAYLDSHKNCYYHNNTVWQVECNSYIF